MRPETKYLESQDAYTNKISAHVTNTSVSQENLIVSQEFPSSEQEMEV